MARYDDLNTKMIAYAAVLSVVILIIVLQGTQALCYNMVSSEDSKKISTKANLSELSKREQIESLAGYKKTKVLDELAPAPKKGEEPAMKEVIQIPIDSAKKLIMQEFGSKPVTTTGT
jgi:hypothetical protein